MAISFVGWESAVPSDEKLSEALAAHVEVCASARNACRNVAVISDRTGAVRTLRESDVYHFWPDTTNTDRVVVFTTESNPVSAPDSFFSSPAEREAVFVEMTQYRPRYCFLFRFDLFGPSIDFHCLDVVKRLGGRGEYVERFICFLRRVWAETPRQEETMMTSISSVKSVRSWSDEQSHGLIGLDVLSRVVQRSQLGGGEPVRTTQLFTPAAGYYFDADLFMMFVFDYLQCIRPHMYCRLSYVDSYAPCDTCTIALHSLSWHTLTLPVIQGPVYVQVPCASDKAGKWWPHDNLKRTVLWRQRKHDFGIDGRPVRLYSTSNLSND